MVRVYCFLSLLLSCHVFSVNETKPLFDCAFAGEKDLLQRVLKQGVDINNRDLFDETALHIAAGRGKLAVVQTLAHHGAQIDARDLFGRTPLMLAAEKGREKTVAFLLKKGANASASDNEGTTVLMWACVAKNAKVIKTLLRNKANLNAKDKKGRTVMDFLRFDFKHQETLRFLMGMGGKKGTHKRKGGDLGALIVKNIRNRQKAYVKKTGKYPYQPPKLNSKKALHAYVKGTVEKMEGNVSAAMSSMEKALKLSGDSCSVCMFELTEIKAAARLYEEADELLLRLSKDKNYMHQLDSVTYKLGQLAFKNEDMTFAQSYFNSITPEKARLFPDIHYYSGIIAEREDKLDLARNHFQNYLAANPEGPYAQDAQDQLSELQSGVLPIRSFDGTRMNREDFKGEWILFNFWSNGRDYEKKTLKMLFKLNKSLGNLPVSMVSINVDEDEAGAQDLILNQNPLWPQFRDPRLSYFRVKHGILEIPSYALMNPEGKIILKISSSDITSHKKLLKKIKKAIK
ncbi:MAG: hypothetical protein CR997_05895 [Acidobacteria bacterium]|nr:MAG: hypothetical protein CR997_05895 [Acidobacteriota bacterium]